MLIENTNHYNFYSLFDLVFQNTYLKSFLIFFGTSTMVEDLKQALVSISWAISLMSRKCHFLFLAECSARSQKRTLDTVPSCSSRAGNELWTRDRKEEEEEEEEKEAHL